MRDTQEYEIQWEYNDDNYIANIEITGQRLAIDGKPVVVYLKKAQEKFKELIMKGKTKPKDRLKFGYWAKGDFIINQNKKGEVVITSIVTKFSGDRFHVEIPKSYRHLFEEGEQITIVKDNLDV